MQIHGKQLKDATIKAAKMDFSGFTPSNDFDPVTKKFLEDNKLIVAPASAPYLQIQNGNELYLKALAITDVHVDSTAVDLAAFVAASYTVGNEFQEGDTIILTAATGGTKIYLHNGDTTLGAADFTEIERPDLTDSYIRNLLTNGSGLAYNPATGEFAVVDSYIRGLVSGNGLIGYDPANGQFSLSEATVRGLLSNGDGLSYDQATGQFSVVPAYIRNLISAGVNLDYNAATGEMRLQAILDEVVRYVPLNVPGGEGTLINTSSSVVSGQQLPSDNIVCLHQSSDILWVGTQSDGVWQYNTVTGEGKVFNTSGGATSGNQVQSNAILSVYQYLDILWVGSTNGLWRYNVATGEGHAFTFGSAIGQQLAGGWVRSVYQSGNILWAGLDGGGLWQFNTVTTEGKYFNTSTGATSGQQLPSEEVYAVHQSSSILWVGTWGGVWQYNTVTGEGKVYNTSSGALSGQQLPQNQAYAVYQSGDFLWVGTNSGIWRYNTVTGEGKVFDTSSGASSGQQLLSNQILSVYQSPGSEILWAATGNGVWKYNTVTGEGTAIDNFYPVSGDPNPGGTNLWVIQYGNILWSASFSGVWRYTLASIYTFQPDDLVHKQYVDDAISAAVAAAAIPDSYIRSLFVDGNGLNYNTATGTFSTDDAYIRTLVGAGRGIAYDALTGTVAVAAPQTGNRHQTSTVTAGNEAATGITLATTPKGFVILAVNGKIESIGDGVKTQRAYFSADGGTTAKTLSALVAGDTLYWNGTVAGYDLDANDTVDIYYI